MRTPLARPCCLAALLSLTAGCPGGEPPSMGRTSPTGSTSGMDRPGDGTSPEGSTSDAPAGLEQAAVATVPPAPRRRPALRWPRVRRGGDYPLPPIPASCALKARVVTYNPNGWGCSPMRSRPRRRPAPTT